MRHFLEQKKKKNILLQNIFSQKKTQNLFHDLKINTNIDKTN